MVTMKLCNAGAMYTARVTSIIRTSSSTVITGCSCSGNRRAMASATMRISC